jgi:hypothetical protein
MALMYVSTSSSEVHLTLRASGHVPENHAHTGGGGLVAKAYVQFKASDVVHSIGGCSKQEA